MVTLHTIKMFVCTPALRRWKRQEARGKRHEQERLSILFFPAPLQAPFPNHWHDHTSERFGLYMVCTTRSTVASTYFGKKRKALKTRTREPTPRHGLLFRNQFAELFFIVAETTKSESSRTSTPYKRFFFNPYLLFGMDIAANQYIEKGL